MALIFLLTAPQPSIKYRFRRKTLCMEMREGGEKKKPTPRLVIDLFACPVNHTDCQMIPVPSFQTLFFRCAFTENATILQYADFQKQMSTKTADDPFIKRPAAFLLHDYTQAWVLCVYSYKENAERS